MAANVQDVVMMFGDSITQGAWEPGFEGAGAYMSHMYARKLDVLNRGFSGYNTEWATPLLEECIARKRERGDTPEIRLLTIWFGANDAAVAPSPQHVPLEQFEANLERWVDMLQSAASEWYSPKTRIVLISPPPVNTYQRRADLAGRIPALALDRDFEVTRTYAARVGAVARRKQVGFVDVWGAVWAAAGAQEEQLAEYLYDGLHLNKAGYKVMVDTLMRTIADNFPDVHPDNVPFRFPTWLQLANQSTDIHK